jgi:UDP-N-acetyl-D-mannosaminuronic acid dehydrogenase
MENTYRDVNIAIANEFSRLADHFGIDIWEAVSLANRHPRVKILNPGPGVGGHCISVDPWFLVEAAPELTQLIHTARNVNDSQPQFVVDWMERKLGNLSGRHICALGLTYKPDVDDFRESPAVEVVKLLKDKGAIVSVYDPFKMREAMDGILPAATISEALDGAEAVVILVAHQELKKLSPSEYVNHSKMKYVFDTVNITHSREWKAESFKVFRLGSNKPDQG